MGCGEGLGKVFSKIVEVPRQRSRSRDENIIATLAGSVGQDGSRGRPQAAFGTVALHRTANLLGGGEAETKPPIPGGWLRGGAEFKCESSGAPANTLLGTQEIGAFFEAIGQQFSHGQPQASPEKGC
jgi:hypothetical protein